MQACQQGNADIVSALLKAGANVHLRGSKVCIYIEKALLYVCIHFVSVMKKCFSMFYYYT